MPIKITIADDHALIRQGLRMLLLGQNSQYEFTEADSLDTTLAALAACRTDLLLIDLGMPGMHGAESLRALREAYPETKIAVITGSDDRNVILDCLGAGIHGYILKASSPEEIERAISMILSGGMYVSPALAQLSSAGQRLVAVCSPPVRQTETPKTTEGPPRLTLRQRDVLRLLEQGHPTKVIAKELDLGLGTVKIHLAAIYRVLHARNRTEAVVLAAKLRL